MGATYNRRRWSDNDRYLGPFTYARDHTWKPTALILGSGDGDDDLGCSLRISAFGHTLITALPAILKPSRTWVDTAHYEWSKSPDGGYWDIHPREYGFSLHDGFLNISLGRVTNDSNTEQRRGYFLPWTQWRHVRLCFYGLLGEHFWTEPKRAGDWKRDHAARELAEKTCPTATFEFDDFDGERISARTRIEEREWRLGEGWFKWLSLFRRARIKRYLAIEFSSETGRRKGSWKGGALGHSIEMRQGEMHESAFRRYCSENEMTFALPLPTVRKGG